MLRRIAVFTITASMVLAMGALSGSAGEITKNGKRPMVVETIQDAEGHDHQILHGKSACAFSGLNDEYLAVHEFEGPAGDQVGADGFGRTQNWGQLSKEDKAAYTEFGAHPGQACRGNAEPPPE